MDYYGFTHKRVKLKKWRKRNCVRGRHLWDEVLSHSDGGYNHYLVCDACQVMINIASVDTTYAKIPIRKP